MSLNIDTGMLRRGLNELEQKKLYAMEVQSIIAARTLESDARTGAPWRDRTGHARSGIHGSARRSGSVITITLSGNVRYLVYLELAHGRKWAALWPAMQRNQERILRSIIKAGGFI